MLTDTQIMCQTQLTKEGRLNMKNRKPFRTLKQKAIAKGNYYKTENGNFASSAPVSFNR